MYKLQGILAFAGLLGIFGPASASTIYSLDTTIGGANDPVAATAEFTLTGDVLQLILSNDTGSIDAIIQELTGITFTISGNPTLSNVEGTASAAISCVGVSAGAPCMNIKPGPIDLFNGTPENPSGGASPTGWAFLPNYALFTFAAGSGSFKPWGIVNDSIVGSGSNGGTSNPPHNPMLVGPVDFDFTFDGLMTAPMITGVQFYWGTGGDHRAGTCNSGCTARDLDPPAAVPEPRTLALLAIALLLMAAFLRPSRGSESRHGLMA